MAIKIICGHSIFNENALCMSNKFNWKLETDFAPKPNDLYIVFGAHEISHQLLQMQYRYNSCFGYVILNSEQVDSQFFKNKYYLKLMKSNVVCDYNSLTPEVLKTKHDIKVFSYFFFEFMKFNVESEREYDVVFVGSVNDKRLGLYQKLKETYPDLNIYFDLNWEHKSAEKLTDLLHKAKVVLNIPYYTNNALETHRINKAIACGCQVISLKSSEDDANKFYEDYVTFTDDIVAEVGKTLSPKKGYEDLVKALSQKINPHFLFVISQVHKKLLSLSNTNEPTTEVVSKSSSSDPDVPSDKETSVSVGNEISEGLSDGQVEPEKPVS
tara:strand:- start:632 stop:1609 length:978 start_codon:yes stop_codon:yes gene_type:complete